MPVANLFIKNKKIEVANLSGLVSEWADIIEVEEKDICLSVVSDFAQAGRPCEVLVHLSLPSLWRSKEIKTIQLSLLMLLEKYLKVPSDQIIILTNIIHSGHVVESGEIETW